MFVEGAAQNRAKLICIGCTVRVPCLLDAFVADEKQFGVSGGMTERERRAALRGAGGDPAKLIYAIERGYEQFLREDNK